MALDGIDGAADYHNLIVKLLEYNYLAQLKQSLVLELMEVDS